MNKRNLFTIGGAVVLGLALVALPANSARPQKADDSKIAHLEQRIEELEAKLQAQMESQQVQAAELNDAVTEINGQRVEGAAQFRRMIHEIPAGRSIQLTVWRDGRTQTISATLGKSEERHHAMKMVAPTPGTFAFRMPEIPEIPSMEWNGGMLLGGQPRLGIDAEDLSGQLGAFFGAPDGEGILVRDVNSGSPAERAGVKAGDVIISFNGGRIRSVGELREKLSAKREDKDRTVKLGVLRNKNEVSLTVELPAPAAHTKRLVSRRTSI